MTTQIANLIAAARKREQKREDAEKAAKIATLREAAESTFTVALREALGMRYEHGAYYAQALFDFDGETWTLRYEPQVGPDEDGYTCPAFWHAEVQRQPDKMYHWFSRSLELNDRAEDALLLALGERHDFNHNADDTENEPPF